MMSKNTLDDTINLEINPTVKVRICSSHQGSVDIISRLSSIRLKSYENAPLALKPDLAIKFNSHLTYVHGLLLAAFGNCEKLNLEQPSGKTIPDRGTSASGLNNCNYVADLDKVKDEFGPEGLQSIINFLYNEEFQITVDNLPQVLAAAHFFGVQEIKDEIGDHFIKIGQKYATFVPVLLHMAFVYQLKYEVKTALSMQMAAILQCLLQDRELSKDNLYTRLDDLYTLNGEVVASVLSHQDILYASTAEETVFAFVIKWLKKNPRRAPRFACRLINACSFRNMTNGSLLKCLCDAEKQGISIMVRHRVLEVFFTKEIPSTDPDYYALAQKLTSSVQTIKTESKQPDHIVESKKQGITDKTRAKELASDTQEAAVQTTTDTSTSSEKNTDDETLRRSSEKRRRRRERKRQRRARERRLSIDGANRYKTPYNSLDEGQAAPANEIIKKELSAGELKKRLDDLEHDKFLIPSPKIVSSSMDPVKHVTQHLSKLLNAKGRRLMKERLMTPNFANILRRSFLGPKALPLEEFAFVSEPKPEDLIENDILKPKYPPKQRRHFLYSPECDELPLKVIDSGKQQKLVDLKAIPDRDKNPPSVDQPKRANDGETTFDENKVSAILADYKKTTADTTKKENQ